MEVTHVSEPALTATGATWFSLWGVWIVGMLTLFKGFDPYRTFTGVCRVSMAGAIYT